MHHPPGRALGILGEDLLQQWSIHRSGAQRVEELSTRIEQLMRRFTCQLDYFA